MTYLSSANGVIITRQRAIEEIKAHGITDIESFYTDCGCKEVYAASEVLHWLGY